MSDKQPFTRNEVVSIATYAVEEAINRWCDFMVFQEVIDSLVEDTIKKSTK